MGQNVLHYNMKRKDWTLEMKSGSFAHYFNMTITEAYKEAVSNGYSPISHLPYQPEISNGDVGMDDWWHESCCV